MVINWGDKQCKLLALNLYITSVCHDGLKGKQYVQCCTGSLINYSCCRRTSSLKVYNFAVKSLLVWGSADRFGARQACPPSEKLSYALLESITAAQLNFEPEALLLYEGGSGLGDLGPAVWLCHLLASLGPLFPFPPSLWLDPLAFKLSRAGTLFEQYLTQWEADPRWGFKAFLQGKMIAIISSAKINVQGKKKSQAPAAVSATEQPCIYYRIICKFK